MEGVRPDIRIINNSLLGIDWYINQLRTKVNQADPVDVIWTPEQIEGHNREYMRFRLDPRADKNAFYPLYDVMKNVLGKPMIDPETGRDVGSNVFPVARLSVPVDEAAVRANGTVNPGDSVVSPMLFEIPEAMQNEAFLRSDLMILNIIAANNWKRPIYFTSPYGELGFYPYLRKDGMAYRLVPIVNKYPQANWVTDSTMRKIGLGGTPVRDNNTDFMFQNLMTKFEFGGAGKKGVYYDEENRRHLLNIRSVYAEAAGNMADLGRKEEAQKLLDKVEAGILPDNLPYAMTGRFNSHNQTGLLYLEAAYKAGKTDLAEKIRKDLRKDLEQQKRYYENLRETRPDLFGADLAGTEMPINDALLRVLDTIEQRYANTKPATNTPTEGGGQVISTPPQDTLKK